MRKNRIASKYIVYSLATLMVLAAGIMLPFFMAQSIKVDALNTIEVIPMDNFPAEKTTSETHLDSLKNALTLLYLNDQDESFTETDDYMPQAHSLSTTEDIKKEIQQLVELGFAIDTEFKVNSVTGVALKNRVSTDIRADYNQFALAMEDGVVYVITNANTGQILSVEFYPPSKSESSSYESMAIAFANYLELGDITFLSQKDTLSAMIYDYLATDTDMVIEVFTSDTAMSIIVYPYTLYPKGE